MKKLIAFCTSLITLSALSATAFLTSSAWEVSNVEGYDYCEVIISNYTDDDGNLRTVYTDRYFDFTTSHSGDCHDYSRNYNYAFITLADETVMPALTEALGEETQEVEELYYHALAENQHAYVYDETVDYGPYTKSKA